jgi:signal transduction histidine kinase
LAEAVTADLDVHHVVQAVARLVTEASGADVCFVHVFDQVDQCLVLAGGTPPFDELAGQIRLNLDEGVAGWVARTRQPALVPNKWQDPRYLYIPALRGEDFASMISVPMLGRHHPLVGVLNLHSRQEGHFGAAHLEMLASIGRLLSRSLENAMLYEGLQEREAALAQHAERVLEAQEQERRRLAREIHDGIAQRLLSLTYRLEAAFGALNAGRADQAADQVTAAKSLVNEALDEARAAVANLRPGVLEDLGLLAALEALARRAAAGSPIVVESDLENCPLPPHVETAVYRVAQEAIQNARRHSGARTLRLYFGPDRSSPSRCRLVVEDDGQSPVTDLPAGSGGFGLRGMRERAELANGSISFSQGGLGGTRVELVLPIPGQPSSAGQLDSARQPDSARQLE